MSAITYDPSQSLPTTWKPNVSFCGWTDVICSRRSQRVVSLNVSSMGLQGIISPVLGNLWFLTILDTFGGCSSLQFFSMAINNLTGNIHSELCVLPNKLQFIALQVNSLTRTIRPAWETYPFWTVYIWIAATFKRVFLPNWACQIMRELCICGITISENKFHLPCLTVPIFYNRMSMITNLLVAFQRSCVAKTPCWRDSIWLVISWVAAFLLPSSIVRTFNGSP